MNREMGWFTWHTLGYFIKLEFLKSAIKIDQWYWMYTPEIDIGEYKTLTYNTVVFQFHEEGRTSQ
jgi:hypothetical protein